ncbi:efflux transporter outer membrane subunit [Hephaestia sp. CMS5P-6]|nr:efflux transporter outer membrane subunit [Hephaestia mangrovi]
MTACTVGPNYHAPEMAVPVSYQGPTAEAPPPGAEVDPATWWRAYGDLELDALVKRALAGNPDIQVAASRVRQARLAEIVAEAQGKPTLDAQANVSYIHFSKNAGLSSLAKQFGGGGSESGSGSSSGGVALPGDGITTYSAGFDTSWELDLFGGARRGVEAARARKEAAVWNGRDAAVTLAAEVADAYFALRADQERARIVNEEIARQTRALQIAAHIAEAGLAPHVDVTRQNASITSLRATLEPINADIAMKSHALGILIGEAPETLTAELAAPASAMAPVPSVPAGLPSDLLRRRPDVRAAERQLGAATADIGVAVADLYPKFNLTGMAQLISSALSNLFTGDSLQLTGTGAVQFPLLDWGRRKATVGMRKEDREQAYLNYRKTVLGALRDVEDALAQIDTERRRNATLNKALADSEETAKSVEAQYRTGFVAQDSLLNAETDVLKAREQVAMSDAQLREYTAALFKALGGGWQADAASSDTGK